jgi:antitoxin (DNA-binding transcriptional repressor) of toxin-antitoxin stability system
MTRKVVAAGVFKQGCLAFLDEVAQDRVEIVVTKRGRPVARLLPVVGDREYEKATLAHIRALAGAPVIREEELLAPSSHLTRWKMKPAGQHS